MSPPIDFNALDTVVHGPLRLGILTALSVDGPLEFMTLKKRLDAADGSLNLHLGKLEESNYITSKRAQTGSRPKTSYRITAAGRKAVAAYLENMKRLINYLEQGGNK